MRLSTFLRKLCLLVAMAGGLGPALTAQVDTSSALTQAPSQSWSIPTRLGSLDALTGRGAFRLPLGPTLPGRIPAGFALSFDGTLNQGAFRPVTWRLGNYSQAATGAYSNTVSLFGVDWVFHTPASTVALPSQSTVEGWIADRHADKGQAQADAAKAQIIATAVNLTIPPTETWVMDRIQTTTDGTKFLIWAHWHLEWWTAGRTDNDVKHTQDLPDQGLVIAGDEAVSQSANVTWVTTRWGDKVSITETTTTDGLDGSFLIKNELVPSQWIQLTLHASNNGGFNAATITVDHALGTPKLPTETVTGYYRVQASPPTWGGSTTWAGQFLPVTATTNASDGSSLTTQFQWRIPLVPGFHLTTNEDNPDSDNIYDTLTEADFPNGLIEKYYLFSGTLVKNICWDKYTGRWVGWLGSRLHEYDLAEGRCSLTRIAPDGSGQTVVVLHDNPQGNWDASNVWHWTSPQHRTYIYTYPQVQSLPPGPMPVSAPYRLVKLTHVAYPTSDSASVQAFLGLTGATVQEERIHGTSVDASGHPTDGVTDEVIQFSGWDLSSWANPAGTPSFPATAVATCISTYRPGLPTEITLAGDLNQQGRDAWGPRRTDRTVTPPSGSGLPSSLLTGAEAPVMNTASTNPSLSTGATRRTAVITRTWNATAATLETLTEHKTLDGAQLPSLRKAWANGVLSGISSADFGTTTTAYDPSTGMPTTITGTRGAFTATETRTYLSGQPLVASVRKALTDGTNQTYPGSGTVGTDYGYDSSPFHWLVQETQYPDGRTVTYGRDDLGRLTATTDVLGITVAQTYDAWGRVATQTRQAKGGVAQVATAYQYDPAGLWKTETVTEGDTGRSLTTRTDYDVFGHVVKVTGPDGSTQTFQYDGYGQKVAQSPVLKPGMTSWGLEHWDYDGAGRLTQHRDAQNRPLATVTQQPQWMTLQGVTAIWTKTQDDRSLTRSEGSDLLGQKAGVIDQAGQLSTYTYDQDGHLTQTQQGAQTRAYTYNDMGWLTSRTEPEEGTTQYSGFTLLGTPLVSVQKGRSGGRANTFATTLNSWMMPASITATGPEGTVQRTLTYDGATHLLTGLSETQPNGTLAETYGYDGLFRLVTKTVSDGAQSFTVSQALDAAGRPLRLTYPTAGGRSDQTVTGYDSLGRPITVTLNGETKPSGSMVYDQVSGTQVTTTLTLGNNAWTTSVVDKDELVRVTHTAAAGVLEDDAVTWTPGGLMLSRGADTFSYDALQRLASSHVLNPATGTFVDQAFTYDRYGNRTSTTTTAAAGTLAPDSEALSWTATYGAGNDLPGTVTAPSGSLDTGRLYDDLGRLTQVFTTPGQVSTQTSWIYDPSGRVVQENGTRYLLDSGGLRFKRIKVDGTITYTIYGFGREPLSMFTQAPGGSLAWARTVVYGFGQELREDQAGASVTTIYLQSDQVGSPNLMTDAAGALVSRQKSLPFGERMVETAAGAPKPLRRFTNHEDDPDSNAVYMQAREYLAAYGKFAQVDPAYDQTKDDPVSWNLYNYVTNNPVTHTDPDGREPSITIDGLMVHQGSWDDGGLPGVQNLSGVTYSMDPHAGETQVNVQYVTPDGRKIGDPVVVWVNLPGGSGAAESSAPSAQKRSGIQIFHYDGQDWSTAAAVTSENRFINGMNNTEKQAKEISAVEMKKMDITSFDLVYIPTKGFFKDLVRAAADKLGFTTQTAKDLAGIIQGAGPGNWYAHSYGGVAFAEAVRTIAKGGGTLAGQSVTFLAGANNQWATNRIMGRAGVTVGGYHGSWFDLVPNVVGMNSLNPIQWAVDILGSWSLATRWSPHTHPPVD